MKNIGSYPNVRMRRNRKTDWSRRLVQENSLSTNDLIWPIFIKEGKNQKEPIIYGYGFGIRSRILGYYVRFDWAWGVNDGVIMPSVKHLSLSLDF